MKYGLGVDLGTTHTAAAVRAGERVEVVQLGSRRAEIPSVVFVRPDGDVLVGEAAERRGKAEPGRLAKEFKRRLGDQVPLLVGGVRYPPQTLMALLLDSVLTTVSRQQEVPPETVVLTCPANWGPYRRGLLLKAVQQTGLDDVELRVEPEAAAIQFSSSERVQPGEVVAVYDLGGGTFDAAVLGKTASGFELLGEPAGVDALGGVDFDDAVLSHVMSQLGPAITDLDPDDPATLEGLARLRRDCVEAKEILSFDTEASIPVALPSVHTRIRLNRAELEAMIAPSLHETMLAMDRAVQSSGVEPASLRAVLLAGGSSRIPLVSQTLAQRYGCPLVLDPQPEHSIALGAAQATAPAEATPRRPVPAAWSRPASADRPNDARPAEPLPNPAAVRLADADVQGSRRSARGRLPRPQVIAAAGLLLVLVVIAAVWRVNSLADQRQAITTAGAPPAGSAAGWQPRAALPVALEGAAVAAYQNKVWVAGGLENDDARHKLTTVFVYDPDSDTWSTGPSLPRPISHGSLVATPWTLYFLAGWVQDGGSAQVLRLNPTNSAWVEDVPLPAPRVAGAAAYDGSAIIYAGGTQKGGSPTDTVWALRGARWLDIGQLAEKRQKLAAVSNNVDTVWMLGGRNQVADQKFGTVDRISQGRVLPPGAAEAPIQPPVDSGAAVRLDGAGICVLGGEVPGRRYNDWWCEQPGQADKLPKLEPQRAGLGAARIGQTLYVVGGYGATFQGTTLVEAYTPPAG